MARSYLAKVFRLRGTASDVLGVSEAVGSILLLGISVTLAGAIALWTQSIKEGEEGLYVDLWSTVQTSDVVITHRGGDILDGRNTYVQVRNSDGSTAFYDSYYALTTPSDDAWGPGEDLSLDLTAVSVNFKVVVTTVKGNGNPTVVMSVDMMKGTAGATLPDLAITMVQVRDASGVPASSGIFEEDAYRIFVRVENFGANLTTPYLVPNNVTASVSNLQIFDTADNLQITSVSAHHFTAAPVTEVLGANVGMLRTGERIDVTFIWNAFQNDPRTLGSHTLNVKVLPHPDGEVNYRNNYVERKVKVNKEVLPQLINGPDPGIYDIYFSNDAPHSGDLVTVTVIIQNSGDESVVLSDHVNLVVSTWAPVRMNHINDVPPEYPVPVWDNEDGGFDYEDPFWHKESYDWKMDEAPYYGQWRSRAIGVPNIADPLTYDNTFPTCVIPNIVLLPGAYFFYYFTLEAKVDVPGGEQWVYVAMDVYTNRSHPQGIWAIGGDQIADNQAVGNIQVLPRILLVDDDEVTTGEPNDMTSSVVEALVGAGVTIDKLYIAQSVKDNAVDRDSPAFDYDQAEVPAPAMEDYDIVIWVTGYVADPLTNKPVVGGNIHGGNIQELMKFMDSDRYLMIVGQSPFQGLTVLFDDGVTNDPDDPIYTVSDEEFIDGSEFLHDYLGIYKVENEKDLPTTGQVMKGLDTGPGGITEVDAGDYNIQMKDLSAGNKKMQFLTKRTSDVIGFELPIGVTTTEVESGAGTPRWSMVRSMSTPSGMQNAQYRAVSLAWDVNQIEYLNEKINLFAGVLRWFDWKINVGRDLAITRMQLFILTEVTQNNWDEVPISGTNLPKYLDTVYIEVTVRNNGPNVESTSVMFYVTGPDGMELPITPKLIDPRTDLEEDFGNPQDISGIGGDGDEVMNFKLWLAVGVGLFTFRVVVDPYHLISEVSEENNDISYSTSTVTSFVTQNNILIIDDDFSDNNFDASVAPGLKATKTIDYTLQGGAPSSLIIQVMEDLGYDYEVHVVENNYNGSASTWILDCGLTHLDFKRYNAIIWVLGDSGDGFLGELETATLLDISNIVSYLDGDYKEAKFLPSTHSESVMLLGPNLVFDLTESKNETYEGTDKVQHFADDYLGIDISGAASAQRTGWATGGPPDGDFLDDIYTGIEYYDMFHLSKFKYRPITLAAKPELTHYQWKDLFGLEDGTNSVDLTGTHISCHEPGTVPRYFRTITQSWQANMLFSTDINPSTPIESPLHEFIYLSLHWFDAPEDRPELLSRSSKIEFDNDNPVLGNSYLVKVQVANVGGVSGGGTVRFTDGNTLIKSENIFLQPDKVATLEAIWTPLYAGDRSMKVSLDYYGDEDEVFDIINNNPLQEREIYFFWDDMENGDSNWNHNALVQLMNGEGKLDYMEEPTTSNVIDTWAEMHGFNFNNDVENSLVEKEYHSSNISYVMHEPNGEVRSPIDVTMVIDTSGSMSGSKITAARTAAKTFVDQMSDTDRVALYRFQPSEEVWKRLDLMYTTTANKVLIKSIIDTFPADSNTPIWDTMGEAIQYSHDNREAGRIPSVVALTDGDDYGTDGYETGSETYAPGSEPGTHSSVHTWGRNDMTGLVWGDAPKSYNNQIGGTRDVIRYYGAYSNLNIESGAAGRSRTGLIHAPVYVFSIGLGINPRDAAYVNGGSNPPNLAYSKFTTEYSLWEIAHTSSYESMGRGKYYYAPTASELQTIYDDIFQEIQNLAQQATRQDTRAGEVLYYKFDEAWGSPTAADSSGAGHTGTLVYSDEWLTPGLLDGGLDMWGDNTVTVPSSVLLDNLNIDARTISFWLNADNTANRQVIYRQGSNNDGFTIYLRSGRLYAGWASSTMGDNYLSIPYTDTMDWHFICLTADFTLNNQVLWIDGIPLATSSNSGVVNADTTGVRIGSSGNLPTRYHDTPSASDWNRLDGFLDEFRIFNFRVSDQDVKNLYEISLPNVNGLKAEYYWDTGVGGSYSTANFRFTRMEGYVNYDWGSGAPPDVGQSNQFVIRWSGYIVPAYSETYTFYARTDDGARLWVNDFRIINAWNQQNGGLENTGTVSLIANQLYPIVLEYYEMNNNAHAILSWSSPSLTKVVVPPEVLYLSHFSTVTGGGGEGGGGGTTTLDPLNPWDDGTDSNDEKWLLTSPIDLRDIDHAQLSFYQKYNLKVGSNGGVIQIGVAMDDAVPNGAYTYHYIQPDQPYTGNTLTSAWNTNLDDAGVPMRWAWNGKSAGGTMDWEFISVNLDSYVGHYIKIKFLYIYNYGGSGFGWMVDDVMVKVTSDIDNVDKPNTLDNWDLVTTTDKDGAATNAWYCGDPNLGPAPTGDLKNGIDNSLYTRPIDLTNAREAYLYAEFKFNIETASGRPPDGFRVEVSTDNGISWVPLSLGVRTAWGVSGTENDASDGIPGDQKSFTGLPLGNYWVSSGSLARLVTNLEGFIGNTVVLRVRVVTNTDGQHYQNAMLFKGTYLDNIIIYGESLEGTRSDVGSSPSIAELISKGISVRSGDDGRAVTPDRASEEFADEPLSGPVSEGRSEHAAWIAIAVLAAAVLLLCPAAAVTARRR